MRRLFSKKNLFGKVNYYFYFLGDDGYPYCYSHVENENSIIYNVVTDKNVTEYFDQLLDDFLAEYNNY